MKALLLSALCALSLNIHASVLPKDTTDKYIIDNVPTSRFDGTQLEGKTIDRYIITHKDNGNAVTRIHVITTRKYDKATYNKELSECKNFPKANIVLDGKVTSSSELSNLKPEDISNILIFKPGSREAKAVGKLFGVSHKNGVILITTKPDYIFPRRVIYIDGKRASKSEMDKIKPDDVVSVQSRHKDDAYEIYITTKGGKIGQDTK